MILRYTSDQPARCALRARSFSTPPIGPYGPPEGTGPGLLLRRAARARSGACKRRMGFAPHAPLFAREACRRRNPPQSVSTIFKRVSRMQTVSQGGRRPEPRRTLSRRRPCGQRRLVRTRVVYVAPQSGLPRSPWKRISMLILITPANSVRSTSVHTEAEDGLRVLSRAPHFVQCPTTTSQRARPIGASSETAARCQVRIIC